MVVVFSRNDLDLLRALVIHLLGSLNNYHVSVNPLALGIGDNVEKIIAPFQ